MTFLILEYPYFRDFFSRRYKYLALFSYEPGKKSPFLSE